MDQGWFRERWIALTAVAVTVAAIGVQVAQLVALANVPPPDPLVGITLFPSDEKLLASGLWVLQGALAAAGIGFGVAAAVRTPGRVPGIVAGVVALGVLVF